MQPEYAERYSKLEAWHWWFRGRQQIVSSILRSELRPGNGLDLLSVGCGSASGQQWLAGFSGKHGKVVGKRRTPLNFKPVFTT